MRGRLQWKILFLTAVPLMTLALGTLWVVNRSLSSQVHRGIQQDLVRASAVFEDMLAKRAEQLQVASRVIVTDPKFFSVLTLPGSHSDPQYRNTVAGVARDFNAITHADLFEVLDAQGNLVATVGRDRSERTDRAALVELGLSGRSAAGILVAGDGHYQTTVTPIVAGGRSVGALLLGAGIDQPLAERLRSLTRSEVNFLSGRVLTGSTLASPEERASVLGLVSGMGADAKATAGELVELKVPHDTYVTLIRRIPGSRLGDEQSYVLQRSLEQETHVLKAIQLRLSQLGVLAILAALGAGLLISRRITNPVQRLVRAAEEIERGNYDFPLDVKGNDEIGYLAARFEDMRHHERAYVTSLQEVARLKSEFISVASHELRTPISIISGYHELLSQEALGPLDERQRTALNAIGDGVSQLCRIADDATRVAQIEGERLAINLEAHDVSRLMQDAVRTATDEARGRHVRVTLEVDRSLPRMRVDGPRLTQAIANLVRNGIRFTPDGGRVDVRTEWRQTHLEITVEDSGVGVPSDRLEQIFEKGFVVRDSLNHHSSNTLEFNSAGLGLGLSIARGIAEAHGGSIFADSEPGRGSRFVIRIPALLASEMAEAA